MDIYIFQVYIYLSLNWNNEDYIQNNDKKNALSYKKHDQSCTEIIVEN